MATHHIDIADAGRGKAAWFYDGELIGESRQPLLDAARWLLANGKAEPDDTIEGYRGGPAIRAKVGVAAGLRVDEPDNGGGPRFRRWKPFSHSDLAPLVSEADPAATYLPETSSTAPAAFPAEPA